MRAAGIMAALFAAGFWITPAAAGEPTPIRVGQTVKASFCSEQAGVLRPCAAVRAACFKLETSTPPGEGTPVARVTIATTSRQPTTKAKEPATPKYVSYAAVPGKKCYPIEYLGQGKYMDLARKQKPGHIVEVVLYVTSLNVDGTVSFADNHFPKK